VVRCFCVVCFVGVVVELVAVLCSVCLVFGELGVSGLLVVAVVCLWCTAIVSKVLSVSFCCSWVAPGVLGLGDLWGLFVVVFASLGLVMSSMTVLSGLLSNSNLFKSFSRCSCVLGLLGDCSWFDGLVCASVRCCFVGVVGIGSSVCRFAGACFWRVGDVPGEPMIVVWIWSFSLFTIDAKTESACCLCCGLKGFFPADGGCLGLPPIVCFVWSGVIGFVVTAEELVCGVGVLSLLVVSGGLLVASLGTDRVPLFLSLSMVVAGFCSGGLLVCDTFLEGE